MQRGVRRRVHFLAASCLTETIPLGALALNRLGGASPQGRALVRGTLAGSGRFSLRHHQLAIRDPAPDFTARRLTASEFSGSDRANARLLSAATRG